MPSRAGRVTLTYDDYARLPEDGHRYELYNGEIDTAPAPNLAHQDAVLNLGSLLRSHVRQNQLGRIFVAPTDVVLSDLTVVQPDLVFVARERESIITPLNVRGAPDLVVEVLSASAPERDLAVKYQLYARYGVPSYWLFDPSSRTARALVLEQGAYREVAAASGGERFSAPPFPDLVIRLAEVWE